MFVLFPLLVGRDTMIDTPAAITYIGWRTGRGSVVIPEFLALKHDSRILGHSSHPVCGFPMMEQVRLCAVWPIENWLGYSLNQTQCRTTVQKSYSRALEQGPLCQTVRD